VHHLFDASCARSLPWAAATATGLVSPTAEVPLVQYHRLESTAGQELQSIWCVTWDSAVFIILVGPRDALAKWEDGAAVLDGDGTHICRLKPAGDDIADLLAPPGALNSGAATLCLQCQMAAGELGGTPFTVPELLAGGIQLVPETDAISRVQELIADLASRNRVASFLANVPAAPHDPQEAATLCFYLRLLDRQGRLPPEDRRQLAELEWVTDDLRDAFRSAPDAEANE